jgi:hypothetical protein
MGLFRRDPPAPETPLPIPRETRVWPKAMPAARPVAVPAPPPRPVVQAKPAPPAAVVRAAPPPSTASTPTLVKPSIAAAPRTASEGKPAEPPPGASRDASSVVAAFASWKQVNAAKTAEAGKTETAAAPVPEGRREDPVMYVYRAAAKQARGEHDAAIEDLSKAIQIDPTCTTAWAGRALSLEAKGDLAGARRDYAKSIEIELRQEIARLARPL